MWIKRVIFGFLFLGFFAGNSFAQLNRNQYQQLEDALGDESFFGGHQTGFMLYDLDSQLVLYEKNSHLRFTPASVTKLFTLFSAYVILNDSTQTLRYVEDGKTIRIWGSADPSWHYKNFYQPKIDSLIAPYDRVIFSDANLKSPAFGTGWQWDDYYYSYSAERSSLPIYGNLLRVSKVGSRAQVFPSRFQSSVKTTSKPIKDLERDLHSNEFYYNPSTFLGREKYIPLIHSPELFVDLAAEATLKTWVYSPDPLPKEHKIWRGAPLYPILKEMMLKSDNFLAEQLMYMVSDRIFDEIDIERTIEFITKTYLNDLPDQPIWVDGSGLSRYNLFTPRSMVGLFEKLYRILPDEQLYELLPTGGRTGTLKSSYQAAQPYIFAKTGSMSNHHSLVGLIRTKSGKLYAFAFMNSNFPHKVSVVRREMEQVMVKVRDFF